LILTQNEDWDKIKARLMKKTNVALLFGGRSAEHEISLASAAAIYSNLDKNKFTITSIFLNQAGQWRQVASPLLSTTELHQGRFHSFLPWKESKTDTLPAVDIYFPVLHGPYGEDGTIQGLFEMAGVPYVGATVLGSAAGMDKAVAKTLFQANNLPVGKYRILRERDWLAAPDKINRDIMQKFIHPFFIKPANLGSSVGISLIQAADQLESGLKEAFKYDRKILVEEGITGREIECSVIGNDFPRTSLPGEVIPYREFYDYQDKYLEGKTRFVIPVELPPEKTAEIQQLALTAYAAVECCGMARIDFFLQEKTQKIYLNEINTIPGFTEISMYPKLWEVSGLPFGPLLEELIELGLERQNK